MSSIASASSECVTGSLKVTLPSLIGEQEKALSALFATLDFACRKHSIQRRKDPEKTPYINHPIGVANIIINEGGVYDISILQAAVLHDTVEDTDTTFEELTEQFGSKVTGIVKEMTDDKTLPKEERKRLQVVNAPKKSYEAKVVKMADKIYNLRDLQRALPVWWTEKRRDEYFAWAQQVCVSLYDANEPLANILKQMFAEQK